MGQEVFKRTVLIADGGCASFHLRRGHRSPTGEVSRPTLSPTPVRASVSIAASGSRHSADFESALRAWRTSSRRVFGLGGFQAGQSGTNKNHRLDPFTTLPPAIELADHDPVGGKARSAVQPQNADRRAHMQTGADGITKPTLRVHAEFGQLRCQGVQRTAPSHQRRHGPATRPTRSPQPPSGKGGMGSNISGWPARTNTSTTSSGIPQNETPNPLLLSSLRPSRQALCALLVDRCHTVDDEQRRDADRAVSQFVRSTHSST